MKVAIVGFGFVGKAVNKLFSEALIYDPAFPDISVSKEKINQSDVCFVCVPTNALPDGSCDISIVQETVKWLESDLIIIRSTVKPGTTDALKKQFPEKRIIFQPEFIGETSAHPFQKEGQGDFLIFGGDKEDCAKAVELYQQVYYSNVRMMFLPPLEAELVKYYCNSTIASKVTLANEFYNICEALGASYDMVREGFLMDPRMSRYFTFVYPDKRGFGGKCIPKDVNAIHQLALEKGYEAEFIKSIIKNNDRIKAEKKEKKDK